MWCYGGGWQMVVLWWVAGIWWFYGGGWQKSRIFEFASVSCRVVDGQLFDPACLSDFVSWRREQIIMIAYFSFLSGFKIASINKIMDTKSSSNKKINLLDYLIMLLEQKVRKQLFCVRLFNSKIELCFNVGFVNASSHPYCNLKKKWVM